MFIHTYGRHRLQSQIVTVVEGMSRLICPGASIAAHAANAVNPALLAFYTANASLSYSRAIGCALPRIDCLMDDSLFATVCDATFVEIIETPTDFTYIRLPFSRSATYCTDRSCFISHRRGSVYIHLRNAHAIFSDDPAVVLANTTITDLCDYGRSLAHTAHSAHELLPGLMYSESVATNDIGTA